MLNRGTLNFSVGETDIKNDTATESAEKADSFVREVSGGICFIFGGSDMGTLYGVYDFIEDVLGVKFVSSDVTVVPGGVTLRLNEEVSISETPAFLVRSIWTSETQSDPLFAARKRITSPFYNDNFAASYGGGMYDRYYNPGHNLNALIASGGGSVSGTVCLSSAATRNAVVNGLKKLVAEYKSASYFAVKTEDGYNPTDCKCSLCSGKTASDLLVDFCNYIAIEINKTAGREIYVVTYAYGVTETPPTIAVNEKVVIELAPITNANQGSAFSSDKQFKAFSDSVSGWKEKVGERLWFYNYGTNFGNYGWYSLNISLMSANCLYLQNTLQTSSVIIEDNHFMRFGDWQSALRTYVYSKVLWNPSAYADKAEVFALAEEFCKYYFGEAAGQVVYEYIVDCENRLEDVRNGKVSGLEYYVKDTDYTLGDSQFAYDSQGEKHCLTANSYKIYDKAFLTKNIAKIKDAYEAANGEYRQRLASVLFTVDLAYFANYKYYLSEDDGSKYFTYDTDGSYTTDGILGIGKKTYDYSDYVALRSEISGLLTVLDGGYSCGELRAFYNATLFKSMTEIAGDSSKELLPGEKQNKAFLTNAASGTAAGFYIVLSENGENRKTSDWLICDSGIVTAKYGNVTFNCTLKGSGSVNSFFVDIENSALTGAQKGATVSMTIKAGIITSDGFDWHVAEDITFNAVFDGQKWCVESYL